MRHKLLCATVEGPETSQYFLKNSCALQSRTLVQAWLPNIAVTACCWICAMFSSMPFVGPKGGSQGSPTFACPWGRLGCQTVLSLHVAGAVPGSVRWLFWVPRVPNFCLPLGQAWLPNSAVIACCWSCAMFSSMPFWGPKGP